MCFGSVQYVALCRFRNTRPITLLDIKFKSKLAQIGLFSKFTGWKSTSAPINVLREITSLFTILYWDYFIISLTGTPGVVL